MPSVLLELPESSPYAALEKRMAGLTKDRHVLVVGARIPASTLSKRLQKLGADMEQIDFVDAISRTSLGADTNVPHATFVPGPHLLELIAARADKLAKSEQQRPVTVIIDDLTTFATYVESDAILQIVQRAIHLRSEGNDQEFAVTPGGISDALRDDLLHYLVGPNMVGDDGF